MGSTSPASVTAALRECETCVANLGHLHLRTRLHITTAQIEGKRGHLRQAEEHLDIAEGLLLVAPNAWLEGLMRLNSSTVYGLKTEFSAAIRLAERALGCAEISGHFRTKLGAIGNLAYLSLWANDIPGARKRCIEGLAIAAHFSEVRIALLETLAQATLAERRGSQCDAILSKIEEATTGDTRFNANWYNVATTLTRTRLHHQNSNWKNSQCVASSGIKSADRQGDTLHGISLRVLNADSLIELERFDEATIQINEAADLADDVPVAVLAEVERARAALVARTQGLEAARCQFERSLRILTSVGGIAQRMDAGRSYQRAIRTTGADVPKAWETQPWQLAPLIRHTLPGKVRANRPDTGVAGRGLQISDLLWVGRLTWTPKLLVQEAFIMLRESGHASGIAIVERTNGERHRVGVCEGWSIADARREAACPTSSILIPLGTVHETAVDLLAFPRDQLQSRAFLRNFAICVKQTRALNAFEEAKRAQSSLMSPDALSEAEDGVFVSESTRKIVALAKQVAPSDVPILITGETGTGKEVLARLIHKYSDRAKHDFVPYNCTGAPKEMVESQLFGHKRGAFTDCRRSKVMKRWIKSLAPGVARGLLGISARYDSGPSGRLIRSRCPFQGGSGGCPRRSGGAV